MKTFDNIEIEEKEVLAIQEFLKMATVNYTIDDILNNIKIYEDRYEVRLSRVSLKDLQKHDPSKFTDGNNNGKTVVIKKVTKPLEQPNQPTTTANTTR